MTVFSLGISNPVSFDGAKEMGFDHLPLLVPPGVTRNSGSRVKRPISAMTFSIISPLSAGHSPPAPSNSRTSPPVHTPPRAAPPPADTPAAATPVPSPRWANSPVPDTDTHPVPLPGTTAARYATAPSLCHHPYLSPLPRSAVYLHRILTYAVRTFYHQVDAALVIKRLRQVCIADIAVHYLAK